MDRIADMLTQIRNASMVRKEAVMLHKNKITEDILKILKEEEFIRDYKDKDDEIEVELRYDGRKPGITELKRVSKTGQRIYVGWRELSLVMGGRGIAIVSTSRGLMTGSKARNEKLGGEYLCEIW